MIEQALSKTAIISQLAQSPHGKLEAYLPVGEVAARQEPEFLSHLIAYNRIHGQVRDAKVALPVVFLAKGALNVEYIDNALAHLALLDVRNFEQAVRFAKTQHARMHRVNDVVRRYVRVREANTFRWEKAAVQHRETLTNLYALARVRPAPWANEILFKQKYPRGSVFEAIDNLKNMTPLEAAGTIAARKIPFLIAVGALGAKSKDPDLVLAMINRMSPSELVNNTTMLQRMGVKTVPALRAAYDEALAKAAGSKKNTLKVTKIIENAEEELDEGTVEKLKVLQEKQIKTLGGIDGNWLVLADKSGSMTMAIEASRHIAATLARMVKGKVWLVFFDTMPRGTEVTGMTYEQIRDRTKGVTANGGTSIGCGLLGMLEANVEVDGIAIVSDGGENQPPLFPAVYKLYCEKFGKEPPVYLYRLNGEIDYLSHEMQQVGLDLQKFDLAGNTVDYYALPNLVQTMSCQRYGLIQKILDTPLLRLDDILPPLEVRHGTAVVA
jgi:hypothetical protein